MGLFLAQGAVIPEKVIKKRRQNPTKYSASLVAGFARIRNALI